MPKVRLLVSMAGVDFSHVPGDIIEVRDDVADAWKNANIAELVEEEPNKKTTLKKGDK